MECDLREGITSARFYLVEVYMFFLTCTSILLYKQAQIVRCAAIVLEAFLSCDGSRQLAAQKG